MAYCRNCGEQIDAQVTYCPKCGQQQLPLEQTQPVQYQYQAQPVQYQPVRDKGGFGWAVLGFLVPLAGLLLFLFMRDTEPKNAKSAGIGALVGTIASVVLFVLYIVFMVFLYGMIYSMY